MSYGLIKAAACAVTAMLVAGAAQATPPPLPTPSGYVEAWGGYSWLNPSEGVPNWDNAGVAARGTIWLAPMWSAQFDASATETWMVSATSQQTTIVGAHLNARDPSRGLLGVFGGVGTLGYYTGDADEAGFGGLEAQAYLGNVTLYGQVGGVAGLGGTYAPNYEVSAWFASATARLFVDPNTKLEASVGYLQGLMWGSADPTDTGNQMTFAAEAEHRFMATPLSVFARLDGFVDPSWDNGLGASSYTLSAGIRVRFGRKTLLDDDRSGTTLTLPTFQSVNVERWLYD